MNRSPDSAAVAAAQAALAATPPRPLGIRTLASVERCRRLVALESTAGGRRPRSLDIDLAAALVTGLQEWLAWLADEEAETSTVPPATADVVAAASARVAANLDALIREGEATAWVDYPDLVDATEQERAAMLGRLGRRFGELQVGLATHRHLAAGASGAATILPVPAYEVDQGTPANPATVRARAHMLLRYDLPTGPLEVALAFRTSSSPRPEHIAELAAWARAHVDAGAEGEVGAVVVYLRLGLEVSLTLEHIAQAEPWLSSRSADAAEVVASARRGEKPPRLSGSDAKRECGRCLMRGLCH